MATAIYTPKSKRDSKKASPEELLAAPPAAPLSFWQLVIPPIFIAISCLALYISSLHYAFQFDDLPNILKFYDIRHLTFKQLFFSSSRWICRWLNTLYYSIGKFDPFAYRLGNVFFHIASSILLFYILLALLRRLKTTAHSNLSATQSRLSILNSQLPAAQSRLSILNTRFFSEYAYSIAFLTSALFALHPVQTQTVSYVVQGQSEGLAGLFMLLIMGSFVLFCSLTNRVARFMSLVALFAFGLLSCGTKEIAIVSPVLVMLVDWFFIAQGSFKSFRARMLLHLLFTITILGMYLYFLKPQFFTNILTLNLEAKNNIGNLLSENRQAKILPFDYLISQFKVILHYATIFIWPFNISVDYDWKLVTSFWDFDCIFPFLILCTLFAIIIKRLRANSTDIISFAAIWFFVVIFPRSSFIPASELLADYKTYTASIAVLLLLSAAIIYLLKFAINYVASHLQIFSRFSPNSQNYTKTIESSQSPKITDANIGQSRLEPLLFCMLLLPVCFATHKRNKIWSSGEAFWQDVIEHAPKKARAYNNYAVALCDQQKYTESIEYFKKAIALDKYYPDPWFNMAAAYNYLGDLDKAVAYAQESIKIYPYLPEAYLNLGSFLLQKKQLQQAEIALKKAINMRPHYGKAYLNLGRVYTALERKEDAYEAFKSCCMSGDFDNDIGFYSYGLACLSLKKYDEAIFALSKAHEFNKNAPEIVLNLAHAYFLSQQHGPALSLYQQLTKLYPKEPSLWFNMGECFAKLEQYASALTCFSQTIKIKQLPVAYLRIAACLERLGRIPEARQVLNQLMHQNPPNKIKKDIQQALALMR